MKIHFYSIIILLGCVLFTYSCEDSNEDSNLVSGELNITANLGYNDGTTPLEVYGPSYIDFSVSSNKGNVDSVQFFIKEVKLESFNGRSGRIHFIPDTSSKGVTDVEMRVTVTVGQKKYYKTFIYKIQYVNISKEDFELKEVAIDRFVFRLIGERLENYKYILWGEIIEDLDNIIVQRKVDQFSFPTESSIIVFLLHKDQEYIVSDSHSYQSVELNFKDGKLGNFHIGSSKFHYVDIAHKELYVWTYSELFIFDKDMNEIKHQPIEGIDKFFVTPKTGLLVVKPSYGNVLTYSDKNFSTIISTIDLEFNPISLSVSEKDQLFNGHNFQIDVYELYTGKSVYTLNFQEHVGSYSLLGDKLLVRLGNDGEGGNQVYKLNEKSATLLYSFEKTGRNCIVHPKNRNQIILDNTYNGFEVFDLESRTTLLSFKGQFQSIDPINGNLLYYDENYSYFNGMYDNHLLDQNYNKIFTFKDASRSTYGRFLQFNNYVIKSDRYTKLLSKE